MVNAQHLMDDFSDNFPNPDVWTPYGGGERETNRRLEIALRSGVANDGGYTSVTGYDLTGSSVHVELVQALRASPALEVYLTLTRDSAHAVSLLIAGGMIFSSQLVAGILSDVAMAAYDPERHRWLRLREQSGTLFYESSADSARWEVLAAIPVPFDLTVVKVSIGATATDPVPSPGIAIFDNVNAPDTGVRRQVEERRLAARSVRVQAAELAAERRHQEHANNNDEVNHPTRLLAGLYSKSLKHDALGDPDPGSYSTLLRALQSRDPGDFEEIILASATAVKLTNPQSGLAFDVAGPDAQERAMPPAPRFDSEVTAHEMGELYWMALARDVWFGSYGTDPTVAAAISSLNGEFARFGGTVPVNAQNVFRGIYPGEQVGPYVSQFLLKGNIDQRKPNGLGQDAVEGFISYGARVIDQRLIPAATGVNHLTSFATWLDVQNGVDRRGLDQFDHTSRRFIRNLRDGATLVHFDQVIDSFYNAAFLLLSEPAGNQHSFQSGLTGRPQVDPEFARNPGNPYYSLPGVSRTQAGFATFGPAHLLQVLSEALGRALRAVWWQKWGVHRRLRPEEYGGRVHNQVLFTNTGGSAGRSYPLHSSITTSLRTGALAPYVGQAGESFPDSYLLPQAYPEGAPTHPAYGAGHATGSGACVTILKAFFDESAPIQNPVLSNSTGLSLVSYTGADAVQMSVGGELNKLAGNIAIFRSAAGVHWRSDYTESLPFGEAIAIGLLQEMSLGFNEDDAFFELTKFDGQKIRIFDGKVVPVV